MRNLITYVLVLGCSAPLLSHADDICNHGYGETICGKGRIDTVTANGVAKMNGTSVEHHTQVNGSLRAKNVKLGTLTVNGDAIIKTSVINNDVKMNGTLNANGTQFLKTLTIASTSANFKKCELHDIVVEKINAPKQKLKLSATKVGGNITFKGNNGMIYLCDDAKISGKVTGGKVIDHC